MKIKEKLVTALGTFGLVLYYLICITVSIFPLVMIDVPFLWTFILIAIMSFIPLIDIPIWIWGLIKTINGRQDIIAILYYIAFAVIVFYILILPIIETILEKNKD